MAQVTQAPRGATAPVVKKPSPPSMPWPLSFYGTAIGKKWAMGISGFALWGFVFVHMLGNLKIYAGPEDFDAYAEFLRDIAYPILPHTVFLWIMRIGLIAMFAIHIHAATTLTVLNQKARPQRYQSTRHYVAANFASRSMRITGVVILAYLIFHLFDLSWTGTGATFVRGDAYQNVVDSLSRPWVAAIYIVGNIALLVHLNHGLWSMFQSLGLNNPRYNGVRRAVAVSGSLIVAIPNILFPIMILAGVVD